MLTGKLVIAAILVGWLIYSGTLDFAALSLLFEQPWLLAMNLAVFTIGAVLGALRWRWLLRLADIQLPLARALQLHLTGMFFNVAVPGNIGGDVLKSAYVARDVAPAKRPTVYVIALVDRLIALAGLVAVAVVLTAIDTSPLRQLGGAVAVLAVVTFIPAVIGIVIIRRSGERLERWRGGLIGQLFAAARLVANGPKVLAAALGLSILVHVTAIALVAALATAITAHDISIASMGPIYSLGMLTMVIPISYAGIGVGHVAFEQLFRIVGLTGGATVFNVYLVGQITPCVVGILPYLGLRRDAAPPSEGEARAQQAGYDAPRDD